MRDTVSAWSEDNAPRMGAALAYYAVFSLAPLLIVAIAIAAIVFERQDAQAQIVAEITKWIGREGAEAVSAMVERAMAPASSAGTAAAVVSGSVMLVVASGAFAELQRGLNEIWRVPPHAHAGVLAVLRLLRDRAVSFLIVLGVGGWFLLSLMVKAAIAAAAHWFDSIAVLRALFEWSQLAVSLGMGTLLFALLFKLVPDTRIAWGDVWLGAVVTAALAVAGQSLITLYLKHSAVSSVFGAAGSLVAILVWVYYSAQIFLFGAELTRVYALRYGSYAASDSAPAADR